MGGSRTLDDIVMRQRQIWGNEATFPAAAVEILGKAFGDLAEVARDFRANRFKWTDDLLARYDRALGNVIATSARLIDDMGSDLDTCLERAEQAQMIHAVSHGFIRLDAGDDLPTRVVRDVVANQRLAGNDIDEYWVDILYEIAEGKRTADEVIESITARQPGVAGEC